MSSYDGPSYFKKRNPKTPSLKEMGQTKRSRQKKTSLTDYESTIPDRIQNSQFQEKVFNSLPTPSTKTAKEAGLNHRSHKVPPEAKKREQFRSKYIPLSLQQLDGWQSNERNKELRVELAKRLAKERESYLLFEEQLAPDRRASLTGAEKEDISEKTKAPPTKSTKKKEVSIDSAGAVYQQAKEKAERVQEELAHHLRQPDTGRHRSLSKIIIEDQKELVHGRKYLSRLFSKKD